MDSNGIFPSKTIQLLGYPHFRNPAKIDVTLQIYGTPSALSVKPPSSAIQLVQAPNDPPVEVGLRCTDMARSGWVAFWSEDGGNDPNSVSLCVCVVSLIIRHALGLWNINLVFRWFIITSAINIAMNMHSYHIRVKHHMDSIQQ